MKKLVAFFLTAILALSSLSFVVSAEPTAVTDFSESAGWYQAVDVAVEKDFTLSVELDRMTTDCGIFFYADDAQQAYFSVKIRWLSVERTDFYACRNYGGAWEGFLIPEEYQLNKKDCFVSVDEGWDTSSDPSMILDIVVVGDTLTVTMTGTGSGNYGTLTYDLRKPAHLDGSYKDNREPLPKVGAVGVCANDGATVSFRNFKVEDTEDAVITDPITEESKPETSDVPDTEESNAVSSDALTSDAGTTDDFSGPASTDNKDTDTLDVPDKSNNTGLIVGIVVAVVLVAVVVVIIIKRKK